MNPTDGPQDAIVCEIKSRFVRNQPQHQGGLVKVAQIDHKSKIDL
jgi:hypothetical protein